MALILNEIFFSIQGESTHAGRPCIFIRLTGCNLRCAYCDTRYAYTEGTETTIPEIMEQISGFSCRLVEVTGGEPLLQADTPLLVHELVKRGHEVMMETNGSLDIRQVESPCVRVVDMKCPGSNESEKNDLNNLSRLSGEDQVKFVIQDPVDYLFAKDLLKHLPREFPLHHVLFSPAAGRLAPEILASWILKDQLAVRLNLQLHKILWPGIPRGV